MSPTRLSSAGLWAIAPAAALLAGGLAAALPAQAANDAWSTSPSSANFSGTNWTLGATTPGAATGAAANGDSLYFGTSSQTTLDNDDVGYTFSGLTFNSGGAAFTIGGNSFGVNGKITDNSSTNIQETISSGISIAAGNTAAFADNGTGGITLSGNLTGAGAATYYSNNSYDGLIFSGDNSGFTGTFTSANYNQTRVDFNSASAGSASAAWVFNTPSAGGSIAINTPGGTVSFGSLSGTSGGSGANIRSNSIGTSILSVGALNTSTTFAPSIAYNSTSGQAENLGLTKVGTGTLTLTGLNNSYSGGTIVNDGTLSLGGVHAAGEGSVTINTGGNVAVSVSNALGANTAATAPTITNMSGGTLLNQNTAATGAALNAQYGGRLSLTSGDTSTLDFGAANKGALFSFTGLGTGTGILDVTDYLGNPTIGGGLDQLFIGTTNSLTSAQLNLIDFEQNGVTLGATTQLADGEVTYTVSAAPEPGQIGMIGMAAFALGGLLLKARKQRVQSNVTA